MDEILEDFREESKGLIEELTEILDNIEGDYARRTELEGYGQVVDRIMGGATSLQMALDEPLPVLEKMGKCAELCKLVGYKASQINDNPAFYDVVVAFLQDATEMLEEMLGRVDQKQGESEKMFSDTFLDRLNWISGQFDESVRASVATSADDGQKNSQAEIDALLKQLGVG